MNIDKYAYPDLEVGDQDYRWCHKYCHDVITGKIVAGRWIKLAAERHFKMMKDDRFVFDAEAAKSVVLFFKFVPITDGKMVGKATVLLPWQIWLVCSIMAWKWKHNDLCVYKYAYVQVGRKNGKSTLAGGLTLYKMYKSGYFRPRAYSVATKRDQAKELWSAASTMIKLSPRLKSIFNARRNDILMPSREGSFVPLASDSNSLDGLNPLMVNLDECHAIKDRNLYDVMISAFGAQDEGLMLTITTAGFILNGLCVELNKAGKKVLVGEYQQDSYFYAIFEIDEPKQWDNPDEWIKANPGIGYQPRIDYMHEQCQAAKISAESKGNFLTKHCNLFVSGADKWLDMDEVKACRFDKSIDDYLGRECYVGLDRSMVSDLTSFCILFPNTDGGADCFYKNFLPRQTVEQSVDILQQVYKSAERTGDLTLLDSATVRDEPLIECIKWLYNSFDVKMFGYDPWHMQEIAEDLEAEGLPMVSVSQGTGNMSEPAKKLEGLIKEGVYHYNSGLLEFAASNAILKITDQNNVRVVRESPKTDKIDPIVSTIIALSCATLQKIDGGSDLTWYEDEDIVFF